MKKLVFILLAVVLVATIAFTGCNGDKETTTAPPSSTSPAATSEGSSKYGGVLKIITGGGVTNLGYPAESVTGGDLLNAAPCVETLVRVDSAGNPIPWLATGWELSYDTKSMTMTLQQGVTFHDGTPFNAEAVKYNLDMYVQGPLSDIDNVSSVEVVDEYTIKINFSQYQPNFLYILDWSAGRMVSPAALQTYDKDYLYTHPVGTGPFIFESFKSDVGLKYTKNENYWQEGKPYLDGIEYIYLADRTVALMAFESGEAQVTQFIDPREAERLINTGNYQLAKIPAAVIGCVADDTNPDSPFADIRVRQAVNYAIPKDQLPALVGYGSEAATQPAPDTSWAYNPDVDPYAYDPEKAKALLAEAGYADGFDTAIYAHEWIEKDAWTAIIGWLQAVGINAKLEVVTWGRYSEIIWSEGWSGLCSNFVNVSPGTHPLDGIYGNLSADGAQSPVSMNYPAEYQETLAKALVETDPAKEKELVQSLMKMAANDYCMMMPMYVYNMITLKYPNVHDSLLYEETSHLWTPEDAWLSD